MKSLIRMLSNKHVFSFAGNAGTSVLAMVSVALLFHLMPDTAEIGGWILFQTAYMVTDTFRSGFLNAAIISFYAGASEERQKEVGGSSWMIGTLITGCITVLLLLAWLVIPVTGYHGVDTFLAWGGLIFLASLPQFMAAGLVQAQSQFDRFMVIRFISQLSFILLLGIASFYMSLTADAVAQLNLIAQLFSSVFCIILGWSSIGLIRNYTRSCMAELFHFGKYSFGSYLSSTLFRVTDTFIITSMLGEAALAVYNLGIRLMELVEIPLRSFAATAMPQMSVAYNQGQKETLIQILCRYTGVITVLMIIPCLFALAFADVAIYLIGGEKFVGSSAATVLRIYMSFALLYPADRFCAIALDSVKMSKINFYKVLAMLVANVGADYLGILLFKNVYGIALGTLIPITIGTIVGYVALQKYHPFPFSHLFRYGVKDLRIMIQAKRAGL